MARMTILERILTRELVFQARRLVKKALGLAFGGKRRGKGGGRRRKK